ncbi:MAG TPA: hypothetical protein VNA19_06310 [Pyrinomonadaceae bacterium]|jgi:heme/copper-type cytochrome/quinol oxidase subunit 2|nr:hypothetical protein [Pyrinomonadaceae bacterium]
MDSNSGTTELILVLVVMCGLLVFGVVAVVIFYRVWRKERGGGGASKDRD